MNRLRTRALVLLLLAILPAGSGVSCSSSARVRLYPVQGQVVYNGRPVVKAMVVFHPLEELPAGVQKPIAYTDAEGRFRLTTNVPGDGALAGEYAVTVELREKTATGVEKVGGRSLLPVRYSKPNSSGLRCQVQEGPNDLAPFMLADS